MSEKKTQLIDVATSSQAVAQSAPMTVADFLENAEIDLSKSKDAVVRVNGKRVSMEDIVNPGDTVLLTRNIEGG